jgi:uncharacterized protein (TIGR02444 family)
VTLWDWALAAWAKPGVEEACLALQDTAGQSVVLILWRAWLHSEGRTVDPSQARPAIALARSAEDGRLKPLRAARRRLPRSDPDYARLRAEELSLERSLIEALADLPAGPMTAAEDLATALAALADSWNGAPVGAAARAHVRELSRVLG